MESTDHRPRVAAERRERMRSRLLAGALQLVARQGPALTSIDDVIQAAGVSRGTFYKYFASPQALIDELAVEVTNELIRMAEIVVVQRSDPAERVACGMRLVARLAVHHPLLAAFLVNMGWPRPQGPDLLMDYVERDLAAGMRAGRFKKMPKALAFNIVSSTVLGAANALLQPGCEKDFPELAVAAALRALGLADAEAQRLAVLPLKGVEALQRPWLDNPAAALALPVAAAARAPAAAARRKA